MMTGTAKMRGTANVALLLAKAGGDVLDEFDTDAVPDELFHYTDAGGLMGMLGDKGVLWASDARCMNDTVELALGSAQLEQALQDQSAHPAHSLLEQLLKHPAYVSGVTFIASFSAKGDLLSQWRAYADNGAGFAVGFRSAELKKLELNGKACGAYLINVEYRQDKQEQRMRQLVDRLLDELKPIVGQKLSDQDEQLLATGLRVILPVALAASKNAGFEEEAEHRLVLGTVQDPILLSGDRPQLTMPVCKFRSGRYGITPFVKLQVPAKRITDALSRIVVGPRAPADTDAKVRVLLANAEVEHWSQFPVERASASYR